MNAEQSEIELIREHVLKVAPEYWSAIADGSKTFEVRRNDRAFQKGDVLVLYPTHDERGNEVCSLQCTDVNCSRRPPIERRTVTFVFSGDPGLRDLGGVIPGYVVLGLGGSDGC